MGTYMKPPGWICCQIGAREHYAVPRALAGLKRDVSLVTDVWVPPSTSFLFPKRWKQRFHPDLSRISTAAWNIEAGLQEVQGRMCGTQGWVATLSRNDWFQRKAAKAVKRLASESERPPVVFAFSYAAARIFGHARELGCKTVLGQIDPGPVEMQIVRSLEAQTGRFRTEWPPDSYWDQWRQECELADCILVNSEWSRRALLQENIPDSKIQIVPLAYENDGPDRTSLPKEIPPTFSAARPLRVLFLGQLISRKGIRELAEAIQRMNGLPVHWDLVGNAPPAMLAALGSLPQTHVPGPVSRIEASTYYQAADVFILPTHSDGFAITQLEAMSFGLPVIASTFCGHVAQHERTGLILPEVSATAIEHAVRRLIDAPELVGRMTREVAATRIRRVSDLAEDLQRIEAFLKVNEVKDA